MVGRQGIGVIFRQRSGPRENFPKRPTEKVLQSFVSAFRKKVGNAGFQFQDEEVLPFSNTKNAQMYHLLYFTHDKTGLTIWNNIKKIAPGGQRSLL